METLALNNFFWATRTNFSRKNDTKLSAHKTQTLKTENKMERFIAGQGKMNADLSIANLSRFVTAQFHVWCALLFRKTVIYFLLCYWYHEATAAS